jgi:hypothetical protein
LTSFYWAWRAPDKPKSFPDILFRAQRIHSMVVSHSLRNKNLLFWFINENSPYNSFGTSCANWMDGNVSAWSSSFDWWSNHQMGVSEKWIINAKNLSII